MSEATTRAKLMARIAAPLLSASIRATDDLNGETLAQHFSTDINRVVPIAQIIVDALKPENDREFAEINAIAAPVAAQLVAQNPDLFAASNADELVRLLKPSINVLASFCDREAAIPPLNELESGLPRSLLALAPIVGCLGQYAFGKSPAKRLTDALDIWLRAQSDLFKALPKDFAQDAEFKVAAQEAAAHLFCAHFHAVLGGRDGDAAPDAEFKILLSQWDQSLALLQVLITHAALEDSAGRGDNVRPLRARPADTDDDEEDEENQGGGSSGSGGRANKAAYNPMSFFTKKGV